MSSSSDIWVAFARTFSMLFLVLALLILAFYLVRRFSSGTGMRGSQKYIKVISVHHLSPKEKLVLVDVLGDMILIGVTPSAISKISVLDHKIELPVAENAPLNSFSDFLAQKLGRPFKEKDLFEKEAKQ